VGEVIDKENFANYGKNIGGTNPVDKYPRGVSPYGVWDMSGNVWEWMDSWNNLSESRTRVRRGGCWYDSPDELVIAYRFYDYPDFSDSGVGFRCALSLP